MLILSTWFWWLVDYRLTADGQDFFASYDEVYDSFDAMGLQENLLRGIYAYGTLIMPFVSDFYFIFYFLYLVPKNDCIISYSSS